MQLKPLKSMDESTLTSSCLIDSPVALKLKSIADKRKAAKTLMKTS